MNIFSTWFKKNIINHFFYSNKWSVAIIYSKTLVFSVPTININNCDSPKFTTFDYFKSNLLDDTHTREPMALKQYSNRIIKIKNVWNKSQYTSLPKTNNINLH